MTRRIEGPRGWALGRSVLLVLAACGQNPGGEVPAPSGEPAVVPLAMSAETDTAAPASRLGPPAPFGGHGLQAIEPLTERRFVLTYLHDRKLVARIGEVDDDRIQYGEPVVVFEREDGVSNVSACVLLRLDDDRVLIVHRAESSELRINVGTSSGLRLQMAHGPRQQAPVFDNNDARHVSAIALGEGRFLVAMSTTDSESGRRRGQLLLGQVDGNQIRRTEQIALARDTGEDTALARLTPSTFVLAVRGFDNTSYFTRAYHGAVEGPKIRLLEEQTLQTAAPNKLDVAALGPEQFLLHYSTTEGVPGPGIRDKYVERGHLHVGSVFQNGVVLGPPFSYQTTADARFQLSAAFPEQIAFAADDPDGRSLRLGRVAGNKFKLGDAVPVGGARVDGLAQLGAQKLVVVQGGEARVAVLPEPPGPGDIVITRTHNLISVALSGDRFIAAYVDEKQAGRGMAMHGSVAGGRVDVDAEAFPFGQGAGATWDLHGARLSDTRFVLTYKEGRTGKVVVGELAGDRLVFGPEAILPRENAPSKLSVSALGADRVAVAYRTSDTPGAVVLGQVDGNTLALGDRFLFEREEIAGDVASCGLTDRTLVVFYAAQAPDSPVTRFYARGVRVDGAELSLSERQPVEDFLRVASARLGDQSFVVVTSGPDAGLDKIVGRVQAGSWDGAALGLGRPEQLSPQYAENVALAALAPDRVVVAYGVGESTERPHLSAHARSAAIHGTTLTLSPEALVSDKPAPFVAVSAHGARAFVVSFTVGESSGRATTRLGALEANGDIRWNN